MVGVSDLYTNEIFNRNLISQLKNSFSDVVDATLLNEMIIEIAAKRGWRSYDSLVLQLLEIEDGSTTDELEVVQHLPSLTERYSVCDSTRQYIARYATQKSASDVVVIVGDQISLIEKDSATKNADGGVTLHREITIHADGSEKLVMFYSDDDFNVVPYDEALSDPNLKDQLPEIVVNLADIISSRARYDEEISKTDFRKLYWYEDGDVKPSRKKSNDKIKSKVIEKLKNSSIDFEQYFIDLEEVSSQIALGNGIIEVITDLAEKDDEVLVDQFYRIIDQFKSQEAYTFRSDDLCAVYTLHGERKDGHVYSFDIEQYVYCEGGSLFINLGDGIVYAPEESDRYQNSRLVECLATCLNCKVVDLPELLQSERLIEDLDFTNCTASDESEVYEWFEDNVSNRDLLEMIDSTDTLEDLTGGRDEIILEFEIDFSDCFE